MSAALAIALECFAPVLLSRSGLRPSAPLIAANDNAVPSSALPPRRSAAFDSQDQMRTLRAYPNIDGEETFTFYSQSGAILLRSALDANRRNDDSIRINRPDIYTDYIRAGGKTIARVQRREGEAGEEVTYMHQNHLGSPIATTDADGQQLWRESYTPYGEKWQSDGDNDDNVSFTGHIHDTKSNLTGVFFACENYTVQARFYDPTIGRFLSIDPVGFLDTGDPRYFNRYAYTANDPVNLIDPTGETIEVLYHEVALGNDHASIRFTPDDQDAYASNPDFQNTDENGNRYSVLSAGPEGGNLVSDVNRESDLGPQEGGAEITLPDGVSEDAAFATLSQLDSNYGDNLDYDLFPANEGERKWWRVIRTF